MPFSANSRGYKAYKVHAYICWNPHKWEPAPQQPGFPKEDIEVCEWVQERLASRAYDKGRLSVARENGVHHFHRLLHEFLGSDPWQGLPGAG